MFSVHVCVYTDAFIHAYIHIYQILRHIGYSQTTSISPVINMMCCCAFTLSRIIAVSANVIFSLYPTRNKVYLILSYQVECGTFQLTVHGSIKDCSTRSREYHRSDRIIGTNITDQCLKIYLPEQINQNPNSTSSKENTTWSRYIAANFLQVTADTGLTWWRHQMETFSALLVICAGNSPVPGEFPAQRPVTRSFNVFFDLRLNKRLGKQSWGWWIETP